MVHKILLTATAAACTAAVSAPVVSADATLTFPNGNAACIAQAWVPFNTDPTVPAGSLGAFIRTGIAKDGALRQNGERGDC